ncbi:HEPN domain-containing protein [Pseudoalteromonas sp. 2CM37A]|uniref:HEPN domain-containing protein n=1 Tax=Pseudoalteromonas sp. 2CM37A TaxID=2929853 RepID=UPI0020C03ACD|nr:HEPN domain-containing protein [Pseudoalteromonas sp. 2CM37A]MCK8117842.1 HEPN domain-containing protein [Pseudoalteromonas sp. 2CM37A]
MQSNGKSKKYNTCVLVAPLFGIKLSKDVNHEFEIEGVTLISKSKLMNSRVSKRLGLQKKFKEYRCFHEDTETFAVYKKNIPALQDKVNVINQFKVLTLELTYILCATQISIPDIKRRSVLQLYYGNADIRVDTLIDNLDVPAESMTRSTRPRYYNYLTINKKLLKKESEHGFLTAFMGLAKSDMSPKMRASIRSCIVFLGHSQNSIEPYVRFLNNMIAIDSILTTSDAKHKETAQQNLESFFGWSDLWNNEFHREKVNEIYRLRSGLVHDGKISCITESDVIYTEFLLKNLLYNFCRFPEVFKNKEVLSIFIKNIQAERTLGIPSTKSKFLPKKFRYFHTF